MSSTLTIIIVGESWKRPWVFFTAAGGGQTIVFKLDLVCLPRS